MSVHAMASTVHIGITSGAVASSFSSTTVLTSADHLLRYYCICHTYCTECCSSAELLSTRPRTTCYATTASATHTVLSAVRLLSYCLHVRGPPATLLLHLPHILY